VRQILSPARRAFWPLVLALPAAAQQFQHTPGAIPGTPRWTEGVELADVDGDGDLDVLFAEGEGFSTAGAKRQNVLLVNQLVETGSFALTEESVARLGAHLSNAKGVTTGDVDGDGYVDLLYLNAFNTDVPFLYMNRGAAQPGFFDLESATRGFTQPYSSAGAQFGDLDDDGDLDVVVCDSGPSFLGGPGGKPHLFLNDGTGHFAEATFDAPTKVAQMDVQLADVDDDGDLDFLGACRASNAGGNHYLMLNDGAAGFTDASSLLPGTSGSVYEFEVGDLDGDTDHDLFFVSLVGFQEGPVRNELVETGSLGFSAGTPQNGSVDDNEITLLDFNVDGELDVLVASLGSTERFYRNQGALDFTLSANRITAVSDSSLDSAAGDLDGDGDYDVVTAQGESNSAEWANKLYVNTGSPDTLPPVVLALDVPDQAGGWPVVLHARVRDHVLDDGVDYVAGRALVAASLGVQDSTVLAGGVFTPAALSVASGAAISVTNQQGGSETLASASPPYPFDYTLPDGGSIEHPFVLPGTYQIVASPSGATLSVTVTGTPELVPGFAMGGGMHRFAVPDLPPLGDAFAVELVLRDGPGNETIVAGHEVLVLPDLGTNYCGPAVPNSSGLPALIAASGSSTVSDDDFHLEASSLPTNQFGYFLVSATQGFVPGAGGSQGNLCLAGQIGRYKNDVLSSGPLGSFSMQVDLALLPAPINQPVLPGDTWNFQAWFRDKNPTPTSNFTDGLEVTFH